MIKKLTKIVALLLVVSIVAVFAVPAFAEECPYCHGMPNFWENKSCGSYVGLMSAGSHKTTSGSTCYLYNDTYKTNARCGICKQSIVGATHVHSRVHTICASDYYGCNP